MSEYQPVRGKSHKQMAADYTSHDAVSRSEAYAVLSARCCPVPEGVVMSVRC